MAARMELRIRIAKDDDGLWYADCLDLPGCHTFGETKQTAFHQIAELIEDRLVAGVEKARHHAGTRPASWAHKASTETLTIVPS